jgi:hypothetical protein
MYYGSAQCIMAVHNVLWQCTMYYGSAQCIMAVTRWEAKNIKIEDPTQGWNDTKLFLKNPTEVRIIES